ncbi:hypothetical protein CAPTEDRAFT_186978 [Capitella teleta]|uniref:Reelin domain-containing protein n=1 Tax=Capitella teleta TaxID=283909 RepID=R7VMB4_CAPTE|nr:hypothetical protein CAPTEDRAFT_186978 [Capitella teleta]|eukprot:ELU18545.1 hypothetical protein CAPTEDRAFT_186978 [Capitella teleta]
MTFRHSSMLRVSRFKCRAIGIVGNSHFEDFVLQAVQTSNPSTPVGQWLHEPIEDTRVESCFAKHDTLINKHGNMHSLFARWLPQKDYGTVTFRAIISTNSTHVWKDVTSEELKGANEIDDSFRHHIVKRDIEEPPNVTSDTTEDIGHSVFILMAILGGYVGMYTIFSFLLI